MLALQPFEECQPIFDLLQACRRRVDAVSEVAKRKRQIFEARLDVALLLHVQGEPRIDGGELAHALPDVRQPGEHRRVGVVELGEPSAHNRWMVSALRRTCRVAASSSSSPVLSAAFVSSPNWNSTSSRRAARSRLSMRRRSSWSRSLSNNGERVRHPLLALGEACPRVEHRKMLLGIEKLLVLVLAVQLDEACERSLSAAAVASAPPMKARLRPCAVISRRTTSSPFGRQFENGFNCGEFLASSDQIGGGAAAQQAGRRLRREWIFRRRFRP